MRCDDVFAGSSAYRCRSSGVDCIAVIRIVASVACLPSGCFLPCELICRDLLGIRQHILLAFRAAADLAHFAVPVAAALVLVEGIEGFRLKALRTGGFLDRGVLVCQLASVPCVFIVFLPTDPVLMGYSSYVSNGTFSILTGIVNSVSANAHTVTSAVAASWRASRDLQVAVAAAEFLALSAGTQALWNAALTAAVNGIAISNTTFRAQVTTVWSAGTTTRANLVTLQERCCSRAETLFGEQMQWDVDQIAKAVNGDF